MYLMCIQKMTYDTQKYKLFKGRQKFEISTNKHHMHKKSEMVIWSP